MSLKPAYMILFALVVLLVTMSNLQSQVEAGTWCFCNDYATSSQICSSLAGKWDGGSCGFELDASAKLFRGTCENIRGKVNCWN
ncbi:hypothetical protein KI688_000675 [Linnemannia hyalina]|uniref:Uncharacterized protein n=1 Tax=Linnemannia hyalina TaxID=64524 RepID=A0A9P8BXQ6_9FUNG|nr:hypothetical protein KI688_000675 [Linnemannia hyalina]